MTVTDAAPSEHVPLRARAVLVLGLAAVNTAVYLAINLHPLFPPRVLHAGAIERALGRHAWTIWPYWLLLLLAPLLALGIGNRRILVGTLRAYGVALALNVAIWIAWPTRLPRAALADPLDAATAFAWRLLWTLDRDTACFPSGHVTLPLVVAAGFCTQHAGARRWLPLLIAALVPSVVTTGQHSVVDVLGGALTALAGMAAAAWISRREEGAGPA